MSVIRVFTRDTEKNVAPAPERLPITAMFFMRCANE